MSFQGGYWLPSVSEETGHDVLLRYGHQEVRYQVYQTIGYWDLLQGRLLHRTAGLAIECDEALK